MSSKRMGVAIVGCGAIGRTHVRAIRQIDELFIVAVVDIVQESAGALAEFVGERDTLPSCYSSLQDALADSRVEIVVIATPSGMHIEQGLAVLAAKRHLIVEKPLDVRLDQAQQIEAAAVEAAQSGIVASVISQHRFDPASQIVAQAVSAGEFGRITSAIASVAWWRSQGYYDSGDWRGTWAMDGGGALMNQGVHTVDLLLWFMGKPVSIHAHTALLAHNEIEVEDTAVATLTFDSGALAVLHATTAAYPSLSARIQIMGSLGSAVIDKDELSYFHAAKPDDEVGPMGIGRSSNQAEVRLGHAAKDTEVSVEPTSVPTGHARQYADILKAIHTGGEPGTTISDSVRALAVVRAVYVSATLGHAVEFDDVLAGKYNQITVRTTKK